MSDDSDSRSNRHAAAGSGTRGRPLKFRPARAVASWDLSAVSGEARQAAEQAAAAEGVTVGVWLTKLLRDARAGKLATAPEGQTKPRRKNRQSLADDPDVTDAVERLSVIVAERDLRTSQALDALARTVAILERRIDTLGPDETPRGS